MTAARAIVITAPDGYRLGGHCWRHRAGDAGRPVVVINPATSVRCRYYFRFAGFLYAHGFDVLAYDYRGIGDSRPARLRGFQAGWFDWGRLDFEAALQYLAQSFPGQPVQVVAHSVGGFLIGMAPSSRHIARVFTMGAQYAYWRDYAAPRRPGMLLKWHLVMPALTALFGYFPGGRLGWLEDTPGGVVRDWTARHPRFEENWRQAGPALDGRQRRELVERFAAVRAPMLAVSLSDDPFGTIAAIRRLLDYYRGSARLHLHLRPQAIGETELGHFAFFNSRYQHSLWPLALAWLRDGQLPAAPQGELTRLAPDPAPDRGPGPDPDRDPDAGAGPAGAPVI